MRNTTKPKWTMGRVFSAPFVFLLSMIMSKHTKRLFYFASLYAYLDPIESLKCDVMAKLNQAMNLARSDNALMVPAILSRVVWSQDDMKQIFNPDTVNAFATQDQSIRLRAYALVKMTSRWMKFGTVDEMRMETEHFIRCVAPEAAK